MCTEIVNTNNPIQEDPIEYFRALAGKIAAKNDGVVRNDAPVSGDSVIKPDRIVELSKEFLASAAKSTKGALAMAKAVLEASREGPMDFCRFCELIGYSMNSSSIRKLRQIGKRHALFVANHEALPDSWTTLYVLTKVPEIDLKEAFSTGKIKPSSTAKDLAAQFPALAPKKPCSSTSSVKAIGSASVPNGTDHYETRIRFPQAASAEQLEAFRKFLDWLRAQSISVEVGDKLEEMLRDDSETAIASLPQAA